MITDSMVALANAWRGGDDSARIALHDLLIEAGYPSIAAWHLADPRLCSPLSCTAVDSILRRDTISLGEEEVGASQMLKLWSLEGA